MAAIFLQEKEKMLRTFIQVSSASLALLAGILLVRGSFALSSKEIARLSSTYYGYNKTTIENLSRQQLDSRFGVILLVLSFIFQTINLCWPLRWCDFAVDKAGVVLGIIFSLAIFLAALNTSSFLCEKTQKEVADILRTWKK